MRGPRPLHAVAGRLRWLDDSLLEKRACIAENAQQDEPEAAHERKQNSSELQTSDHAYRPG